MQRCKFCKKPLPAEPDFRCPHCFAAWTPDDEEVKVEEKPERKGEE